MHSRSGAANRWPISRAPPSPDSKAHVWYQVGRRRLSEELGLEPGETLQQLERAILNHDPALDPAAPASSTSHPSVPTGTVTFVFTDVEGSTALVKKLGDGYGELLQQHHRVLRTVFGASDGHEID